MSFFSEMMLMALYYFIFGLLIVLVISQLQKGFFFTYCRVRSSFGKFKLVKIFGIGRTYYSIGHIEEKSLVFKDTDQKGGKEKRITIPDSTVFYRSLAVDFIDIDGVNWSIRPPFDKTVTSHDPEKENDLYKRALYRPSINSTNDKVQLVLIIFCLILLIVAVYLAVMNNNGISQIGEFLKNQASTITSNNGAKI